MRLAALGKRHRNQFESAINDLERQFRHEAARDKRKRSGYVSKYELLCGFVHDIEQFGAQCEGDRRLTELRRILDAFEWQRSPDQQRFHDEFIKLCLPHIYGDDFEPNRARLMEAFRIDCFKSGCFIMCPRRWGKTVSVAQFVVALLLILLGKTIVIFAPVQEQADMLKALVEKLLHEPGINGKGRIVDSSHQLLKVATTRDLDPSGQLLTSVRELERSGRVNVLKCLNSNVRGLKGISFDIAILEEAALIPEAVMEAFAPCLGVRGAVFFAITTAMGEDNYVSVMFNNNDPMAQKLFSRVQATTMCAECKENGASARQCALAGHEKDRLPAWKASRNNEQISRLMPKDDLFESEIGGMVRSHKSVFLPAWITNLERAPPFQFRPGERVAQVHTFIDPSGGGQQSELGTVSMIWLREYVIICGLGSHPNQNDLDEQAAMQAYFNELRHSLPYVGATTLLVNYVERNYGGGPGASRLLSYTAPYQPVHSFCERYNAPGVTTDHRNKAEGVAMLSAEMAIDESDTKVFGRVRFAPQMAWGTRDPERRTELKQEFFKQLGRIQRKLKPRRDGTYTYYYTGKNGAGARDDMAMSLCLLMWWQSQFQSRWELAKRGVST
jgi:hypothetical protein